jgi:hypothetical protein
MNFDLSISFCMTRISATGLCRSFGDWSNTISDRICFTDRCLVVRETNVTPTQNALPIQRAMPRVRVWQVPKGHSLYGSEIALFYRWCRIKSRDFTTLLCLHFALPSLVSSLSLGISTSGHQGIAALVRFRNANMYRV